MTFGAQSISYNTVTEVLTRGAKLLQTPENMQENGTWTWRTSKLTSPSHFWHQPPFQTASSVSHHEEQTNTIIETLNIELIGQFLLFSCCRQQRMFNDDDDDDTESTLQWKLIKVIKVSLFDAFPFQQIRSSPFLQIRSSPFLSCHLSLSLMMCVYCSTARAEG